MEKNISSSDFAGISEHRPQSFWDCSIEGVVVRHIKKKLISWIVMVMVALMREGGVLTHPFPLRDVICAVIISDGFRHADFQHMTGTGPAVTAGI